jgi:hypothetical protein
VSKGAFSRAQVIALIRQDRAMHARATEVAADKLAATLTATGHEAAGRMLAMLVKTNAGLMQAAPIVLTEAE